MAGTCRCLQATATARARIRVASSSPCFLICVSAPYSKDLAKIQLSTACGNAASSILVIFSLTPVLMHLSDSYLLDGSVGTQSVHVNVFRGIVSIRDNNVLSEWDALFDYINSLLAAKLFGKMACVLAKMDQAAFPSLDDIRKALDTQASKQYPSTHGLTYSVIPIRVKNLAQYGMPIKHMCREVPTYFAQQKKEGAALAINPDFCFEVQLLSFMGLSICGEILGL
ncbi:gastrokine-3-like [Nycticebus coucang]|uniref:gastrokine-3-like n=1 Tax=Nycticebus coucang TaxID=9470 RepID=UPI00234D925E|nr:gastrokine-3-like [Nycticebus coucang]